MKIFEMIRKHLIVVGMESTQSTRLNSFNGRLSMSFLLFINYITSSALFLIYSANLIIEFMQCFCIISALIEIGFCFAAIAVQKQLLFNYIESMEKLINKSEFEIKEILR